MPRFDGTGPLSGGGLGRGRGAGMGGPRKGRMGGSRAGVGPGGECVCTKCGTIATHKARTPCYDETCPKCGAKMTRK